MKQIGLKSALLGAFFTTTMIFALGATGYKDREDWDDVQLWDYRVWPKLERVKNKPVGTSGWEFVEMERIGDELYPIYRKRLK